MSTIRLIRATENIDWNEVAAMLKRVGMAVFGPDVHKKAFENSYTKIFVFDGDELIGFGRAISDGAYEAAIYDIAVLPERQGDGIGKLIIGKLLADLENINVILFASPGKEPFYAKLGFRKMKTGMARFAREEEMRDFIVSS